MIFLKIINVLTKQKDRTLCFHCGTILHGSKINDSMLLIKQEEDKVGKLLITSLGINDNWRSNKLLHP